MSYCWWYSTVWVCWISIFLVFLLSTYWLWAVSQSDVTVLPIHTISSFFFAVIKLIVDINIFNIMLELIGTMLSSLTASATNKRDSRIASICVLYGLPVPDSFTNRATFCYNKCFWSPTRISRSKHLNQLLQRSFRGAAFIYKKQNSQNASLLANLYTSFVRYARLNLTWDPLEQLTASRKQTLQKQLYLQEFKSVCAVSKRPVQGRIQ